MNKSSISRHNAPQAPAAIGPYCHAVEALGFVFLSGQIPLDPATGELIPGGIEAQTEQVLKNIAVVLSDRALTFSDVVKTTIFLTDLSHFQKVNALYARAVQNEPPARSTVQVAALPKSALVEIEVIAVKR